MVDDGGGERGSTWCNERGPGPGPPPSLFGSSVPILGSPRNKQNTPICCQSAHNHGGWNPLKRVLVPWTSMATSPPDRTRATGLYPRRWHRRQSEWASRGATEERTAKHFLLEFGRVSTTTLPPQRRTTLPARHSLAESPGPESKSERAAPRLALPPALSRQHHCSLPAKHSRMHQITARSRACQGAATLTIDCAPATLDWLAKVRQFVSLTLIRWHTNGGMRAPQQPEMGTRACSTSPD